MQTVSLGRIGAGQSFDKTGLDFWAWRVGCTGNFRVVHVPDRYDSSQFTHTFSALELFEDTLQGNDE